MYLEPRIEGHPLILSNLPCSADEISGLTLSKEPSIPLKILTSSSFTQTYTCIGNNHHAHCIIMNQTLVCRDIDTNHI